MVTTEPHFSRMTISLELALRLAQFAAELEADAEYGDELTEEQERSLRLEVECYRWAARRPIE